MTSYEWLADDAGSGHTGKETLDQLGCADLVLAVRTSSPLHARLVEWLAAMGLDTANVIAEDGWYCVCGELPELKQPPAAAAPSD